MYDTCNGIPQCRDRSDEDASTCPSSTLPPRVHQHLRPDMDPLPAQQQQQQQQQFPFQQQQGYWQQQQYPGFQNPRQGSDYFNPGSAANILNNNNYGRPNYAPDFVYQNPQYPQPGPQYQPQQPSYSTKVAPGQKF